MITRIIANLLILLLAASAIPLPAPAAAPEIEKGRIIYKAIGCAQCHGYVGQGSSVGPRLAGKALSLNIFSKRLRMPLMEMPPYSEKVLNAQDLSVLFTYVSSLK